MRLLVYRMSKASKAKACDFTLWDAVSNGQRTSEISCFAQKVRTEDRHIAAPVPCTASVQLWCDSALIARTTCGFAICSAFIKHSAMTCIHMQTSLSSNPWAVPSTHSSYVSPVLCSWYSCIYLDRQQALRSSDNIDVSIRFPASVYWATQKIAKSTKNS